jgi:hypothetical protein
MNQEKISELLQKYRDGDCDGQDLLLMENLLEKGLIHLEDIDDLSSLERQVEKLELPEPPITLDDKFYQVLSKEKKAARKLNFSEWFSFEGFFPKLAIATLTFVIGLGAGYLFFGGESKDTAQMQALGDEVKSLKEMMLLSLLEKESATERLRAVNLSQEMEESSIAITTALIKTLNNDENVNVRLAALDALKPYGNDSEVRKQLIRSISKQNSALVQIALADLMASLQEKSSLKEFDKLLDDENTPGEVKKRIRKSIQVLI